MYVVAVALVLSEYPFEVIREVTDPRTGIAATAEFETWMPQAGQIRRYCETLMQSRRAPAEREARLKRQLADRAAADADRSARPSYQQLKEKYGPSFGIGRPAETPEQTNARWAAQTKSWDEIKAHYEADPERWQALIKPREDGLR